MFIKIVAGVCSVANLTASVIDLCRHLSGPGTAVLSVH